MSELRHDLRFAARTLRKSPAAAFAAVVTLALGIGATTAVFSTVNATLLRPLPYPRSQDLYSLGTAFPDGGMTIGLVAPAELIPLSDSNLSIIAAAGSTRVDATVIRSDGTPLQALAFGVSEGFFELFGLPLTLGTGFTTEHFVPGGPSAVVLSHHVWREMFAGDPAIIGAPVRLDESPLPLTVVGVAARDFDIPRGADFWINLRLNAQSVVHNLEGYLRLQPGTTPERLQSELAGVMSGIAEQFPATNTDRLFVARPLVGALVGDLGPTLVVVLCATGLLLLLACVNVTTLLLARGATRAREIALRVALGASRGRIVRQLLTESVALATLGAIAGLCLAYAGVRLLLLVGAEKLPRLETVPFDLRVLLFALAALVVSGVLVGFAPALRLATTDVRTLVNDSGRAAAGGRSTYRLLGAMTVAEVALAIMLLAGAGWLVRSYDNLRTSDPGFQSAGRIVFDLPLPFTRYKQPAETTRELLGQLRGLAGVTGVGAATSFPLGRDRDGTPFVEVSGVPYDPNRPPIARQRTVSAGFFDAMGIKVVSGRGFTDLDGQGTAPVVIVNRTFVRRYLGGQDPAATQIAWGYPAINAGSRRPIVGVVDDVKYASLGAEPEPIYYLVQGQGPTPLRQSVVVATSLADPSGIIAAVRSEVHKLDPQIALEIEAVPALVASSLSRQQLGMTLMMVFGGIALALAAVGLYGVIAYASAQRSGEVATRMALGATRSNIFRLMVGQGGRLATIGAILGLAGAYATGRLASSWLYEVRASDPMILTSGLVLVVGITLFATLMSARRATRIDPAAALHSE